MKRLVAIVCLIVGIDSQARTLPLVSITSTSVVVIAGDSITSNDSPNFYNCWKTVRDDLTAFYGGSVTFVDSGIHSAGMLHNFPLSWSASIQGGKPWSQYYITDNSPTVLLFAIGVNDAVADSGGGVGTGYNSVTFKADYITFLTQIFKDRPTLLASNVVLVSNNRDDALAGNTLVQNNMDDVVIQTRAIAAQFGCQFVDMRTNKPASGDTVDGIHPNGVGQARYGNLLLPVLSYSRKQKN